MCDRVFLLAPILSTNPECIAHGEGWKAYHGLLPALVVCVCELSVQRLLPYQDLGSSRKSATSISKQTSHCMTRVQTIISFRSTDIGQYCCYLDYYLYTIFPLRLRSSPSTPMQLPNILHDHNILYNISPTKTLRTSATHHTFLPNRSNEPTRSTLHI
jgi:hypothetical protein